MIPYTAVTCTRDRPFPFSLCARYLSRQTFQPTQWLIVDDGDTPIQPPTGLNVPVDYQRRDPLGDIKLGNTLPLNILHALPLVKTPIIVFFEDDDWYAPDYVERLLLFASLNPGANVVGECPAVYYRLKDLAHRRMHNRRHASLAQTVVKEAAFRRLSEVCRHCIDRAVPFVDLELWNLAPVGQSCLTFANGRHLSIKQLPGRAGTTSGWRESPVGFVKDGGDFLRGYVGLADYEVYMTSREGGN